MSFIKKIQTINRPLGDGGLITSSKAKKARSIRAGLTPMKNKDGSESTHVMEWGDSNNKKYKYSVNPTVFPEGDGKWKNLTDKGSAAYEEAKKRGEVFGFKSAKRAEKFSAGSWKQGAARKEAMKGYRQAKRAGELYTQSEDFKNR